MVPFSITGIFDLIVAVTLVTAAVRLMRQHRSPALLSYLFYLFSWYALVLYMLVYLYSPLFLPDNARHGYLLYNSIFIVPFHGLIAYFFIDFVFKLMGRTMPKLLRLVLPACFLIIWVLFAREMLIRLFAEKAPNHFVLTAPFSGYLVFACLFGALLYAWTAGRSLKDREKRRCVLMYSAVTAGGLLAGLFVVTGSFSFLRTEWQTGLTSMILAAVNIPGLLYLRRYFASRARAAAAELAGADLSLLEDRYGITPREREIISLVITGRSNREITEELFISPETVKKHIYNAYRKIGVRNRVQLLNAVLDFSSERS